jgi:TPR repeat protein
MSDWAFLVEHGFGGPSDLDEARDWLCNSAEQNNALAWNNLGTLWMAGGNREKARQCYRRAAELGFTMAVGLAE